MKLYKYALIGVMASGAALSGCSLDYVPEDQYSDVTIPPSKDEDEEQARFETATDVENYMNAINNKYRNQQEHWYLDQLLIADSHSDNAYAGTTGAEVVPYEDNSIEGSNSVLKRDWDRYLGDVAYVNVLINEVDKVKDNSLSASEITSYQAQGRLFRAMIWFDMVRLWGDIPVIKATAKDITADNIDESYEAYFPEQSTELEAYEAIVEDLEFALVNCPANNGDKSKLTQEVAMAMLAKVYAEKPVRDYSKVIQYADQLASRGYGLVDDFADLWALNEDKSDARARNTKEAIYEAHFAPGAGSWVTWMFGRDEMDWNSSFTWAKWITPSRDLINEFTAEGDNVRYPQSVVWRDCTWSNYYPSDNYAFMYKCRANAVSIIKMRYADILLLKAEAKIVDENTRDLAGAADIIDQVRERAGLGKLPNTVRSSQEALLEAYLKERRLELCFEGQRWFDLVRLNMVEKVMNAVYAKDSGRHAQRNIFNENSYRLAIPQGAIDQNDNLVQNPGY